MRDLTIFSSASCSAVIPAIRGLNNGSAAAASIAGTSAATSSAGASGGGSGRAPTTSEVDETGGSAHTPTFLVRISYVAAPTRSSSAFKQSRIWSMSMSFGFLSTVASTSRAAISSLTAASPSSGDAPLGIAPRTRPSMGPRSLASSHSLSKLSCGGLGLGVLLGGGETPRTGCLPLGPLGLPALRQAAHVYRAAEPMVSIWRVVGSSMRRLSFAERKRSYAAWSPTTAPLLTPVALRTIAGKQPMKLASSTLSTASSSDASDAGIRYSSGAASSTAASPASPQG